jgi:hypothetical protein
MSKSNEDGDRSRAATAIEGSMNSLFLLERIAVAERIEGHQADTSLITYNLSNAFR